MVRHRAVAARPVVEPNAPRPYRAPVHQLAIAHRGDRAIVGIAHAGEILAAVQLDRDAARALGATDDELANAAGHRRHRRMGCRRSMPCDEQQNGGTRLSDVPPSPP